MSIIKKVCSLMLIFAFLLSMTVSVRADVLFDTNEETQSEEINPDSYGYKAIQVLKTLGLISEIKDSAADVTRGEFASVISKIMISEINEQNVSFVDVSSADSNYSDIMRVVSAGYMNGYEDCTFLPNNKISRIEAVCVFVKLLGYDNISKLNGGYHTGYIYVAQKLDLFDGVETPDNNYLNYGDMCVMTENVLNADLQYFDYGSDDGRTVISDDKQINLMQKRFDTYSFEGVVTDNGLTAIDGDTAYEQGKSVIDGVCYNDPNGLATDLIGCYTDGYYKKNSDDSLELKVISCNNKKRQILDIPCTQWDSLSPTLVKYSINNSQKNAKISSDADYIYNGLYIQSLTEEFMNNIAVGELRLIDYTNDGTYDLLIINSYESLVVSSVEQNENWIFGMYDEKIDLDDYESYNINKAGENCDILGLKNFDVYDIIRNKKLFKAELTNDSVYGLVSSIHENDRGYTVYTIDGKDYLMSPSYLNSLKQKPSIGSKGTFYIGKYNTIAYFENDEKNEMGYLHKIWNDDENEDISLKIFTSSGEWVTYKCAERVSLNGESVKREELMQSSRKLIDSSGNTQRNVVTYEINKNGLISKLRIPDENKPDEDVIQTADENQDLRYNAAGSGYGILSKNINAPNYLVRNPVYFTIPKNPENTEIYNVSTSFSGINDKHYTLSAYYLLLKSKQLRTPDIIVQFVDAASGVSKNNGLAVVCSVSKGINDDDEACDKLNLVFKGKEETYNSKPGRLINGLEKGDIILPYFSPNGEIAAYQKIYSVREDMNYETIIYSGYNTRRTAEESQAMIKALWGISNFSLYDSGKYYVGDFKPLENVPSPAEVSSYSFDYMYSKYWKGVILHMGSNCCVMRSEYSDIVFTTRKQNDADYYSTYVSVIENLRGNGKTIIRPGTISDICVGDKVFVRGDYGNGVDIFVFR